MPCMDYRDNSPEPTIYNRATTDAYQAFRCGLMRSLLKSGKTVDDITKEVDWADVGIPKVHFEFWWETHRIADDARIEREKAAMTAQENQRRLKAQALAKLSLEERNALGI